jgi:hypothetical protein
MYDYIIGDDGQAGIDPRQYRETKKLPTLNWGSFLKLAAIID